MRSGNRQLTLAFLIVNQNDQPDEHHVAGVVDGVEDGDGVDDGVGDGVMAWRWALPVAKILQEQPNLFRNRA
jgi:hypothetical protein